MIKKILNYILKYISLPMLVLFVLFLITFKLTPTNALFASFVFTLGINIVIGIFVFPIIIGKTLAHKTIQYEKLTKEDILKNKEIYREILKNHSPSTLSYIDNMSFKFESTAIATLLSLKQKKYIDFNNNQIIKSNNLSNLDLKNTENYILSSISNGKAHISKNTLQNNIIKDSLKEGLIEANYNLEKSICKKIIMLICIFIFLLIIVIAIDDIFANFIGIMLFIITTAFPLGSIIYIIRYYMENVNNPLFRTTKGNEINKNLEGLKNYIKEYSLLKEKDDDSLTLWEDYLIYAVIFGQNNKITEDLSKYIILN